MACAALYRYAGTDDGRGAGQQLDAERLTLMSARFERLAVDLEHLSPGHPRGYPVDEVSYRGAAVGMDPHRRPPSNHPTLVYST